MLQLLFLATLALGQSASPTAYTSVFEHTVTLPATVADQTTTSTGVWTYVGQYTVTDTVPPSPPVITGNVSTLTVTTWPLVDVTASNGSVGQRTQEIVMQHILLQNATLVPVFANGGGKAAVGEWRDGISETTFCNALKTACPHFLLSHSQWDTWQQAAIHFVLHKHKNLRFSEYKVPTYTDTPLPSNFHTLCKDVEKTMRWDYSNKGVWFEDKLLNLQNHSGGTRAKVPQNGSHPVLEGIPGAEISYHGFKMIVPGKLVQARHSSKVIAAVCFVEERYLLLIKYKNSSTEVKNLPDIVEKLYGFPPLRLQVIEEYVYLAMGNFYQDLAYTVFFADKTQLQLAHNRRGKDVPGGMLGFNGNLYDVFIDDKHDCSVRDIELVGRFHAVQTPALTTLTEIFLDEPRKIELKSWDKIKYCPPGRHHKVFQDEKYARYGVIQRPTGLAVGLIDMEVRGTYMPSKGYVDTYEHSRTNQDEYFLMIGVSGGKAGVWKYSKRYLEGRYRQQHGEELPEELAQELRYVGEKGAPLRYF